MKIYIDTNTYCRPFDDQSQKRIAKETDAFATILESEFEVVSSDVLEDEVSEIESRDIRIDVKGFLSICKVHIPLSDEIVEEAKKIMKKCGVGATDALHLASAMGNAEYFITCDDFLIKKAGCIKGIKIVNPVSFAEEFIWLK